MRVLYITGKGSEQMETLQTNKKVTHVVPIFNDAASGTSKKAIWACVRSKLMKLKNNTVSKKPELVSEDPPKILFSSNFVVLLIKSLESQLSLHSWKLVYVLIKIMFWDF